MSDERPQRAGRAPQPGAGEGEGPLLSPRFLARLERLQLMTRRRLAGDLSGEHRSPEHGETLDFAEYREYYPGDDFRRVDYQALARLDQLLVRLFEAEDDLTVRLVVDTSASMAPKPLPSPGRPGEAASPSGPGRLPEGSKLHLAARVAAALGFVALLRRDVVTLHTFPLERPAPRFTGRHATHALFRYLESLQASGATSFTSAVRAMLGRPGPRGLTVLISDLLTPEWQEGLSQLPARGGDLLVVHVLAASELSPNLSGDLDLVDVETGQRMPVSLSPQMLREYRALAQAWLDDVAQRCRQLGAAYVRITDGDDMEQLLLSRWRTAGVLR